MDITQRWLLLIVCSLKKYQKTVMKYLQKVPIHKDDLFFIQAGTVHAIGAGALVAEIQENSNLKKSKQRSAKVQKNI